MGFRHDKTKLQDTTRRNKAHLLFPKFHIHTAIVIPGDNYLQLGIDLPHHAKSRLVFFNVGPYCQVAAMDSHIGLWQGATEGISPGLFWVRGWVERASSVGVRDDQEAGSDSCIGRRHVYMPRGCLLQTWSLKSSLELRAVEIRVFDLFDMLDFSSRSSHMSAGLIQNESQR